MLDAGDFAAFSFLDPLQWTFRHDSTQLHHPTKTNMSAASLVINLLTGHHRSNRTFILTVAAQVEFRFIIMAGIPDLILRFHPLELEFMKDTEVLKDAYLRYEEILPVQR